VKVFRIPVKIEVSFFAIVVFLALSRSHGITLIVEWVVVVFVSVLLHEFGHALAARAFGLKPEIRLYQMGGLTSWRSEKEVAPLNIWPSVWLVPSPALPWAHVFFFWARCFCGLFPWI